jgi:hypothetical protein
MQIIGRSDLDGAGKGGEGLALNQYPPASNMAGSTFTMSATRRTRKSCRISTRLVRIRAASSTSSSTPAACRLTEPRGPNLRIGRRGAMLTKENDRAAKL